MIHVRCLAILLTVALVACGAGCKESEPDGAAVEAPPVGGSKSVTRDELDGVTKASKRYRLALVVKTRNNPFFDPMIRAAEAEARRLGVELEVQAPPQETDKEQQAALIQHLIARGVDAILIAPADSKGIVPVLNQAQEKGILVINLDNRVDAVTAAAQGLALGGYVGADNEEGGRLAGKAMVEAISGQGRVAILEGIRGADNAEARKRGFERALPGGSVSGPPQAPQPPGPPASRAAPGAIQIVASETAEWDTQKAYAKFQSMLAAHPDLNGLFCANDKMALGAIRAIAEARRPGQIKVIGYDNIPDVRRYLDSGEMYATIEQHPDLMGKYGVLMAVGVLHGLVERGREFLVPLEVITGKR